MNFSHEWSIYIETYLATKTNFLSFKLNYKTLKFQNSLRFSNSLMTQNERVREGKREKKGREKSEISIV